MAAARFWRMTGIATAAGSLALSGCHLYSAAQVDPHESSVALRLLMDDAAFSDDSPSIKAVINAGGVTRSEIAKFGTSAYFDGSSTSYLSIPSSADFQFGQGDFTIEAWIYIPSGISGSYAAICDTRSAPQGAGAVLFKLDSSLRLGYYGANGGEVNSSATVPLAQWVHVALSRVSGIGRMFINGEVVATFTDGDNKLPNGCRVGRVYDMANPGFTGYIDELRITKGVGRYVAGFTVPDTFVVDAVSVARVDVTALFSASVLPTGAALSALKSQIPEQVCRWPAAVVQSPGFALTWDLGNAPASVGLVALGAALNPSEFPQSLVLESSGDGLLWENARQLGQFPWPGALAIGDYRQPFLSLRKTVAVSRSAYRRSTMLYASAAVLPAGPGSRVDIQDGGAGHIHGVVQEYVNDSLSLPLRRRVRLVHQKSGRLVREAWSDAVTGDYEFAGLRTDETYHVETFDHEGRFRGVMADGLVPQVGAA